MDTGCFKSRIRHTGGGGVKNLACAAFKDTKLHREFAYPRISTQSACMDARLR